MMDLGCLPCILLVPLAAAGLGLIHQGLSRSRSAAHTMLTILCALAVSAAVFVLFGSALAGAAGGPARTIAMFGHHWNWLGADAMHYSPGGSSSDQFRTSKALLLCLEMFAAGLASVIPLGAGSDRWRLASTCLASVFTAGVLFPLFAHWVWGGGWLAQLGPEFNLTGFVDPGGVATIQVLGGLASLCVAWIVGPRRGKFAEDGMAAAIPGHNMVLVLFGCLLTWVGWVGLEIAVSVLVYAASLEQLVWLVVNAMLSASAGALAALVVTRARYRKPDASLCANGWVAGIVAGSAACGFVSPVAALDIGVVAGVLATYMIESLELRLRIDDPAGSISVHAGAGIWGLIAVGIFGHFSQGSRGEHILAQIVGIAALVGFMLPLTYAGNLLLNRISPYRVDNDGEWQGMDIRELGAGAYPEFVIHADDFAPR